MRLGPGADRPSLTVGPGTEGEPYVQCAPRRLPAGSCFGAGKTTIVTTAQIQTAQAHRATAPTRIPCRPAKPKGIVNRHSARTVLGTLHTLQRQAGNNGLQRIINAPVIASTLLRCGAPVRLPRRGARSSSRTHAEGPRRWLIHPEAASLRAHRRPVARSQPPADTPRAACPVSGINLIYAWDGAADAGWL